MTLFIDVVLHLATWFIDVNRTDRQTTEGQRIS